MTRSGFSARTWCVALVCSALMVVAVAAPAGATGTASHVAPVNGRATYLQPDGSCPPNPDYPTDPGYRERIVALTRTRVGPALLQVNVCYIFVGANGGQRLHGSFSLVTFAGTLRGTADGTIGYGATDHYTLTLTVERASFFLAHVRGTMTLEGDVGRDGPAFTGMLTSDLHLNHWFARVNHPTRWWLM
jgi:hypothetical protein